MGPARTPWWWILLLYAPVAVFYAAHYTAALVHPGITPTGFVQYDLPYSMACAREFADNGLHGLLFTVPSNAGAVGEPVLLQLHLWALGQAWRLVPLDPGLLYVAFGLIMGLLAVRAFIRLFDTVVQVTPGARWWGHVLLLWGGGLLALSGEAVNLLLGRPVAGTWLHLLDLDPAHGWWMMSLGRCLILPNEAYYHWLFFSAAAAFLRKRHVLAVGCLVLLAASHPFSGVGGLVVFFSWSVAERVLARSPDPPIAVPLALAAVFATCCWYYFAWLPPRMDPRFTASIPLAYVVEARSILPAYVLVLVPVLARFRSRQRLRSLLADRTARTLLVMAGAQFVLENHELLITPYQPAHFTRGYTWTALFLLGAPWLFQEAWPWVKSRWPRARGIIAAGIVLLFLSDNVAFFVLNIKRELRASMPGFWLDNDQVDVLRFLGTLPADGPLVIAQEEELGYMIIVYTPLRAYRSHFFDEAEAWSRVEQHADYFKGRVTDPLLTGPLIVIADNDGHPFVPPGEARLLHANAGYLIYRAEGTDR